MRRSYLRGLERLEQRLPLSHSPMSLPDDIGIAAGPMFAVPHFVAPPSTEFRDVNSYTYDARFAPMQSHEVSPSDGLQPQITQPQLAPGQYSGFTSPFATSFHDNFEPNANFSFRPMNPINVSMIEVILIIPGPSELPAQHADLVAPHNDPASISAPSMVDSRFSHGSEPTPSALVGEQRPAPLGSAAEPTVRPSQISGAMILDNKATTATPSLPPSATMSLHVPTENGHNRTQPWLSLVPQGSGDVTQGPNATLLQPEADLNGSDSARAPGEPAKASAPSSAAIVSAEQSAGINSKITSTTLADLSNRGPRAALLASLPFNMEVVDQALDAMLSEVEGLGGELAMWLDDANVPPWAVAVTAMAAGGLGGHYVRRARARRSSHDDSDEESSSWLFIRLQTPQAHT